MYFELERIERYLTDLKKYINKETYPLKHCKMKLGFDKNLESPTLDDSKWESYSSEDLWGGYDQHVWFRTTFTVPDSFNGQYVLFQINTGHAEGWDISNPQFLCYLNGKLIQGLDVNHRSIILSSSVEAGATYTIALAAYSGLNQERCYLKTELITIDLEIKDFYYNLKNLFGAVCILDENDLNRTHLLASINEAINTLDCRKIYSKDFYTSLHKANDLIKTKYYSNINTKGPVVTAIGHTHIDMAWLWTVDQTREKVVRSFSTVLNLMDQYPDYKFMSSQPQLYAFLKEEAPDLYLQVKEKVKEGRWEIDGGMWVEADCNMPSGESLVKQFLFGTRFFKEEFGVNCKTLWLPDVFGYSAALPQIMQKCGIPYFFTTKLDWNDRNKMPHDTFVWQGIDGSEVFSQLVTTTNAMNFDDNIHKRPNLTPQTTYNGRVNPNQVLGNWTRYQDKHLTAETLQLFGFGDGGGGPTEEMLENAKRLKYGTCGLPRVQIDFQKNFFDRISEESQNQADLAKWVGELYFESHRGTYTSMAKNKRFNRKAEFLYQDIETIYSLLKLLGEDYPQEQINKNIKLMLLNQFHDIIPGTAIEKVYEQTDKEYKKLFEEGEALLENGLMMLASKLHLSGSSLLVFNTLSYDRTDVLEIPVPTAFDVFELIDNSNSPVPYQLIEKENKILFLAKNLPAKGYTTYKLAPSQTLVPLHTKACCTFKDNTLETPFYKVTFDKDYCISSLYDKTYDREIISKNGSGNVLQTFEDRPSDFENWNIDRTYTQKMYEIKNVEKVELIENGSIRACLEITRTYYDSTLTQKIYFYSELRRIDFKTTLDWHEKNILLKVAFPVDIHSSRATYEIQYGNVERTTHNNTSWDEAQFEVCGHKWADLSEMGYGVSLLNDCKYGYDIKDHCMKLTLLKCGTYPNPNADLGLHEFTYSLYPHENTWREADTQKEAYNLNVPLRTAYIPTPHEGTLPSQLSMLSVNQNNCIIEVIKKAEDSEDLIIRVFEYMNKRTKARIRAFQELDAVYECNLLEENPSKLAHNEHDFDVLLHPYEIKTYRLHFK